MVGGGNVPTMLADGSVPNMIPDGNVQPTPSEDTNSQLTQAPLAEAEGEPINLVLRVR